MPRTASTKFLMTAALLLAAVRVAVAGAGDPPPFVDVTSASGLVDPGTERGVAWGDYDNDGDPDIFIAVLAGRDRLYRNEGGGRFTDVTQAAALTDSAASGAPAWGDYDGDGDLDLYVAGGGPNRLYRNDDGVFGDVAAEAGVAEPSLSWGAAWSDFDRDGRLDLYVVNFDETAPNRLYRNLGDGTFSDVAPACGVADSGLGASAAWGDADGDGDPDLYVTNKGGADRFYRNDGGLTFTADETVAGTAANGDGVTAAWADANDDGDLDLFVSRTRGPDQLLLNAGADGFRDAAPATGLDHPGTGRGATWGDFDNDGDLDLYLALSLEANRLYRNDGHGAFSDISAGSGTDEAGSSATAAWADMDGDGDLDLLLSGFGGPLRLYENRGPGIGHWLAVDLRADGGNSTTIGAVVTAYAGGRRTVRLQAAGAGGYQSQAPGTVHFGLGVATFVDSLVIAWPDGSRSRHGPFGADRRLVIRQRP